MPRNDYESYHETVLSYHPDEVEQTTPIAPIWEENCQPYRLTGSNSEYEPGAPVGKSCAQIGIANDGSVSGTDSEVFEKWSQALASAEDLADEAAALGETSRQPALSLILPILVVPDGNLWSVDFAADGTRLGPPKRVDRCPFWVDKSVDAGNRREISLSLSHLEFVTLSGLVRLLGDAMAASRKWFLFIHGGGEDE